MNAPIGLRIRSETPEEIAISIAAELILRRAELRDSRAPV
jgi:xanthine/CO dehydrogenase XdhC/CoxF family maturation factor